MRTDVSVHPLNLCDTGISQLTSTDMKNDTSQYSTLRVPHHNLGSGIGIVSTI